MILTFFCTFVKKNQKIHLNIFDCFLFVCFFQVALSPRFSGAKSSTQLPVCVQLRVPEAVQGAHGEAPGGQALPSRAHRVQPGRELGQSARRPSSQPTAHAHARPVRQVPLARDHTHVQPGHQEQQAIHHHSVPLVVQRARAKLLLQSHLRLHPGGCHDNRLIDILLGAQSGSLRAQHKRRRCRQTRSTLDQHARQASGEHNL